MQHFALLHCTNADVSFRRASSEILFVWGIRFLRSRLKENKTTVLFSALPGRREPRKPRTCWKRV